MATQLVLSVTAATAQAQAALASLQSSLQSLSAVRPTANFSGLTAGVGTATAAIAGLVAAVASMGLAFKRGFNVNSELEGATLGIKSLIVAMFDVRNASGGLAKGPEELAIAGQLAEEQLKKLKLAGMETAATTNELANAFRAAVSAGASAGLTLDQIRELTVGVVQAAGAMTVPMDQLNQEVRSLLAGDISNDSTVANGLGITNAQVKLWKEQDRLFEELNKRLEVFKRLGPEAANTWESVWGNAKDALDLFLGAATKDAFDEIKKSIQSALKGAFDPKTMGASEAFVGLQGAVGDVASGIGTVLSDAIDGAVAGAKLLSGWFDTNKETTDTLGVSLRLVWDNLAGALGTILKAVAATAGWVAESGLLSAAFQGVALLLALLQDGFSLLKALIAGVGADIFDKIGGPLRTVLGGLREFFEKMPGWGSSLAAAVDSVMRTIPENGDNLRATAASILEDFQAGRTAVEATKAAILDNGKAAREAAAELRREQERGARQPGGRATPKQREQTDAEKDAADKAAKAAARAAEQLRRAERQLADAEVTAAQKRSASLRETEKAQLEAALSDQLVSYEAYLGSKAALDNKAIDEELAAQRLKLKQLQDDERDQTDPARKVSLQADVVKANADIDALEQRKVTVAASVALDVAEFKKTVASLSVDIKANILDASGGTLQAGLLRLGEETSALLKDRRVAGNAELEALVRQQSALRETRLRFDEASGSIGRAGGDLSGREADIARQVEQGQLTQLEGERALRQARLASAAAIREAVTAAVALAAATNDPALIQSASELERRYKDLAGTLDTVAVSINESFFGSIKAGFGELITGAKSFGDVLTGIISNVLSKLADLALDQALGSLTKGLGGAGGGLGGLISGLLGSIVGFSEGGPVRGPGTGTSDSIFARLSNEEFVLKAAAVRAIGVPRLNFMNRYGKLPAFAAGGLVGGGGAAGGGLSAMSPNITNEISVAPRVTIATGQVSAALMQDPAFTRGIIAVVSGNGNKIQSAWR